MPLDFTCQQCGATFHRDASHVNQNGGAKYCSLTCYYAAPKPIKTADLICEHCKQSFTVRAYRAHKARYCSYSCRSQALPKGPASTQWRGGRSISKEGYVVIWSGGKGSRASVFEHRHVMQEHLGRPLLPDEHVHHINGDKADNRIENLQVMSQSEHLKLHHNISSAKRTKGTGKSGLSTQELQDLEATG